MNDQRTVRDVIEFSGVGLHTGSDARVRLRPGVAGSGLRFRLLERNITFPAHAEYVVETRRATVLGSAGATVSTVEHLMSALLGMGVDNALIEIEGPEVPVMDGSAAAFAEAIAKTGLIGQHAPARTFTLEHPVVFRDGEALLAVVPADSFRVRFTVDYAPPVGAQFIDAPIAPDYFIREIAPARTFGYLHEVEALRSAGLARGGSLDNALVFAPDGPLTPLRWPSEVVRHKVLDLVGDFALLGARPCCEVVSVKSGHRLHAQAVQALRRLHATQHKALHGA
ncbi:MAG: UDP-3-O-[3-hydroxymyristoyl] N-acetylglucosamine deacetylase [Candidatus Eremiobacteraeota bacterium]|nr:UDP-3-O-[3-hydroxymyristoyl] N-acetylglucosamine deacetylase [Candidatus Eremiobacteraeota bacterium]MBC5802966.1 UDP-3-O-[3-hydroxymyristoyl] N-acetylglucosamine deacetylase [Candidatus Eremiobacteraeota bacterium]MBC5822306.1 UDP-3-O-[3-hydroxymyristoyl] N-acetylglucosamine deacetylase [Candidatus Eremiobacteraeota bacterium]